MMSIDWHDAYTGQHGYLAHLHNDDAVAFCTDADVAATIDYQRTRHPRTTFTIVEYVDRAADRLTRDPTVLLVPFAERVAFVSASVRLCPDRADWDR